MSVFRSYLPVRCADLPLLLVVLAGCSFPITPTTPPLPTATSTPAYQPFKPLLTKWVAVGPVYVTGDQDVPDAALKFAGTLLNAMLLHRPDIGERLRMRGAFTVVASHDQTICDLPYFSQESRSACSLFGRGGAGGTLLRPITACDERNLLEEPDDPYERGTRPVGQNMCVHELAHTIMNVGLTKKDLNRIHERYLAVLQEGRWKGDFALTNDQEFWTIMSQFYFWAGPSEPYAPPVNHVANGPKALKKYDPATFALLDSIYQGSVVLQ
jgi:hypothetical protein